MAESTDNKESTGITNTSNQKAVAGATANMRLGALPSKTYKLRLKGPAPDPEKDPATVARITHLAFEVNGQLVDVPVGETPIEVDEETFKAISKATLPQGYSFEK